MNKQNIISGLSEVRIINRGQTTFSTIFIHKKVFFIKSLTLFLLMSIQPLVHASTWQGLAVQNNKPAVVCSVTIKTPLDQFISVTEIEIEKVQFGNSIYVKSDIGHEITLAQEEDGEEIYFTGDLENQLLFELYLDDQGLPAESAYYFDFQEEFCLNLQKIKVE